MFVNACSVCNKTGLRVRSGKIEGHGKVTARRGQQYCRGTGKPPVRIDKKTKKPECPACRYEHWQGVPHEPTCAVGAKRTLERVSAMINELSRDYVGSEDADLYGEAFEHNAFDLHDLLCNLAVLASEQAKRAGVTKLDEEH